MPFQFTDGTVRSKYPIVTAGVRAESPVGCGTEGYGKDTGFLLYSKARILIELETGHSSSPFSVTPQQHHRGSPKPWIGEGCESETCDPTTNHIPSPGVHPGRGGGLGIAPPAHVERGQLPFFARKLVVLPLPRVPCVPLREPPLPAAAPAAGDRARGTLAPAAPSPCAGDGHAVCGMDR